MIDDRDPEGFDKQHFDRKQQRKDRLRRRKHQYDDKRMHDGSRKEKWHWDGKINQDE